MNGSVDLMLTDYVDYESFPSIIIFVECTDNGVPSLSIKVYVTAIYYSVPFNWNKNY